MAGKVKFRNEGYLDIWGNPKYRALHIVKLNRLSAADSLICKGGVQRV